MIREGQTWKLHKQADAESRCDGRLVADGPASNSKRLVQCNVCGYLCAIPSSAEPSEYDQEAMRV